MKLQNKNRIFVKNKNIKNIAIPILFIFSFILVLFNKTDYFLIDKVRSSGINIINDITDDNDEKNNSYEKYKTMAIIIEPIKELLIDSLSYVKSPSVYDL